MFDPVGSVCLSLGSVVMDRPDRTGLYIAKDIIGGWAYLVADVDGDNRFRGQGVCAGGLDMALRCAFLAAAECVAECRDLRILVETRQAHRAMVRLALADARVVALIAGRPIAVMTRPQERSLFQVRSAAERAALSALQDRERAEWREARAFAKAEAVTALGASPSEDTSVAGELAASQSTPQGWRTRRDAWVASRLAAGDALPAPAAPAPSLVVPRDRALAAWLKDLNSRVADVRTDLHGVGA